MRCNQAQPNNLLTFHNCRVNQSLGFRYRVYTGRVCTLA